MVEVAAQSTEQLLVDGFSYKLDPSAPYVQDRKMVTFHPSGADSYAPSGGGSKIIKFPISASGFLDPSSVRLEMTITNNDSSALCFLSSGIHPYFRRCRISCKGVVIEDIDNFNRIGEMMSLFESEHVQENNAIESATRWDRTGSSTTKDELNATAKRVIGGKILSGLLSQEKFIPLNFLNSLDIELELCSAAADAVKGTTPAWTLSNCQLKADIVQIDSELENKYTQHLMEGNEIRLRYSTFITQENVVPGATFSVNISRALSRLQSVFVSFDGTVAGTSGTDYVSPYMKEYNRFWSPMTLANNTGSYDHSKELDISLQVGAKRLPEFPVQSAAESFQRLKQSLGLASSPFHSISIKPSEYYKYKYILGIDTEKMTNCAFSGMNTKQTGSLMTLACKPANAASLTANPTKVFITLMSEQIMSITDSGVHVAD